MPLSTAQALTKWDADLSLLAEEKARAAAHPGPAAERLSPARLQHLEACLTVATHELPSSTLQKLLQKQVPRRVLAGCSELPTACLETAVSVAEVLITRADECLHSAPPGSSTSRLAAEMWEQIEQSGFLQQLPRIFDSHIQALQARVAAAAGPSLGAAPAELDDGILLNLLAGLNSMRPLHTFAAGVQCLVPAMQLSMLSLRHLSTTLARAGRQPWMAKVLRLVWNGVSVATPAAASLLDPQQAGASSSSGGGSTSQQAAPGEPGLSQARAQAVQAMLRAEATMQCLCLAGLVWMLVQHIQQASRPPGDQWLPAALAPSLPAAYSTMLEQLGCSREAGLWLADVLKHLVAPAEAGPSSGAGDSRPWVVEYVLIGLTNYSALLQACDAHSTLPRKRLAPLLLSVPGTTLQWLLGMPPACLRRLGDNLVTACHLASETGKGAQKIVMQHDWRAGDAKPGGALELMRAANTATLALGTALLDKLLGMCRPMPRGPSSSSSGSGSGSGRASTGSRASLATRRGDRDLLLQCCPFVVETLALALAVLTNEGRALAAGCGASAAAAAASRESHLLPVGCGQLCKLLQEFARRSAAAVASAPPGAADEASQQMGDCVLEAFRMLVVFPSSDSRVWALGGPLVWPVAAVSDLASPDALELLGLYCSMLKAIRLTPIAHANVLLLTKAVCVGVSNILRASFRDPLARIIPGSASSTGTTGGTSPCAADALPWLVLLGRCCLACAALLQLWQSIMSSHSEGSAACSPQGASGVPALYLQQHWASHRQCIVDSLGHLQSSSAEAAKWLTAAGPMQQLAALGYEPLDLKQQLVGAMREVTSLYRQLQAPDTASITAAAAGSAAGVLNAALQQLQAAAKPLTSFAIPNACNNPACASLSSPSEAQLVRGRGSVPHGPLLWQGLPGRGLARTQACVQGAGSGGSGCECSRWQ